MTDLQFILIRLDAHVDIKRYYIDESTTNPQQSFRSLDVARLDNFSLAPIHMVVAEYRNPVKNDLYVVKCLPYVDLLGYETVAHIKYQLREDSIFYWENYGEEDLPKLVSLLQQNRARISSHLINGRI